MNRFATIFILFPVLFITTESIATKMHACTNMQINNEAGKRWFTESYRSKSARGGAELIVTYLESSAAGYASWMAPAKCTCTASDEVS